MLYSCNRGGCVCFSALIIESCKCKWGGGGGGDYKYNIWKLYSVSLDVAREKQWLQRHTTQSAMLVYLWAVQFFSLKWISSCSLAEFLCSGEEEKHAHMLHTTCTYMCMHTHTHALTYTHTHTHTHTPAHTHTHPFFFFFLLKLA